MSPRGVRVRRRRRRLESTIAANRAAFERRRIVPRMLRDVSSGTRASSSSGGGCRRRSCSRRSACSSSRTGTPTSRSRAAAAAEGVPMIFSNQASRPMEDVRGGDGRRAALVPALLEHVRRARRELRRAAPRPAAARRSWSRSTRRCSAGARATSTSPSCRSRVGKGIAQYTSDPVFTAHARRRAGSSGRGPADARGASGRSLQLKPRVPRQASSTNLRSGVPRAAVRTFLAIYSRPVADLGRPRLAARA